MLRIWMRQGGLFAAASGSWAFVLLIAFLLNILSRGDARWFSRGAAIACGAWFSVRALAKDASIASQYFRALPIASTQARRLTLDAGLAWLVALVVVLFAVENAGPAQAVLDWLARASNLDRAGDWPRVPSPALENISLPLLGYAATSAMLLHAGRLRRRMSGSLNAWIPALSAVALLPILLLAGGFRTDSSTSHSMSAAEESWLLHPAGVELAAAALMAAWNARFLARFGPEFVPTEVVE